MIGVLFNGVTISTDLYTPRWTKAYKKYYFDVTLSVRSHLLAGHSMYVGMSYPTAVDASVGRSDQRRIVVRANSPREEQTRRGTVASICVLLGGRCRQPEGNRG